MARGHGRLLIGAVCILFARTSHAEESCADAFSAGPEHVKAGRLIQGQASLTRCSSDACPASMRNVCAGDLHRLEDRIPTIVFAAKDASGKDLADVKVMEGTKTWSDKIDGRSFPIDPGSHSFVFERAGSDTQTVTVVIREGEHARPIEAKMTPKEAAPKPKVVEPPPPKTTVESRPIPWPVYVTGGLTVVAAAGFGIFGFKGMGERSDLDSCKGSCAHGPVQDAKTSFLIADISLVAGVVLLGATAVFYVTRPTVTTTQGRRVSWPLTF